MSDKVRLDQLVVDLGLAQTRTKAQALIMANKIQIEGKEGLQLKAGSQIRRDTPLLCL
ncbi:MAG: TlyA family rRNA (cytidine-2'-O)-methyltransferase, partial [Candidatus Lindowbacteria bacterium]|nr:TlyA family rRNA (cytidine-2'-O)-methyltransferase [Candidatus Lindowbacteria bacterium]